MGIAAVIGIVSSVIQAVRAFSPPETQQAQQPPHAADRLFARLDELGRGEIGSADLQSAFEKMRAGAAESAEKLFTKLDADGDGKITKSEFSGSLNRLAEHLDHHYMRLRLQGGGAAPQAAGDAGFSRDELSGLVSNISANFDKADANGDGRVSLKEARAFGQTALNGATADLQTAVADNRNVELMLQVVRLMQAYGIVGGSNTADNGNTQKVSDKV
jgi:Ca2+-binding EF-hand superfamily protein